MPSESGMYSYDRTASASVKLDSKTRADINHDLIRAGLDGNGRFKAPGYAHGVAGDVLEKYGYEFAGILSGWDTREDAKVLSLDIAKKTPDDPFSPVPVSNTALYFSYTKLADRRYEVVAYLG
jgi:hypothetical protein